MTDERKRTIWPWVSTMLIGFPLLYVASFGPACWLCEEQFAPTRAVWTVFRPLTYLVVQ